MDKNIHADEYALLATTLAAWDVLQPVRVLDLAIKSGLDVRRAVNAYEAFRRYETDKVLSTDDRFYVVALLYVIALREIIAQVSQKTGGGE